MFQTNLKNEKELQKKPIKLSFSFLQFLPKFFFEIKKYMYHFNWSLPKICYSNAYRMTHIQRRDEDKNNSENYVNIEEQKIGQYSFAEGLWKDLTSATFRQFYNRLQLKLSVNSLKKIFKLLADILSCNDLWNRLTFPLVRCSEQTSAKEYCPIFCSSILTLFSELFYGVAFR